MGAIILKEKNMQGTLYVNSSDERYVNKSLSTIGEYNIVFKSDENSIRPTLKISDSNIPETANYVYLSELNRYYYIRKKRYSKQCIYLECELDPLMSFRSQLGSMEAIISRNERLYNLYLNDDKMEMLNYPYYQTLNMKCVEGTPFSMGTNQILLALVGAV